ncbi:hypothetical protein GA0070603_1043 [Micromonospora chersina]|uniref:Uncharacterized protein n=2 Tax=Micromonospora chersina TaxID=47854 RepID=A0A1C6U9G5_9ACTN|nr:hypothetical protein GA0070603_1043 [Micromonospora chersina]
MSVWGTLLNQATDTVARAVAVALIVKADRYRPDG